MNQILYQNFDVLVCTENFSHFYLNCGLDRKSSLRCRHNAGNKAWKQKNNETVQHQIMIRAVKVVITQCGQHTAFLAGAKEEKWSIAEAVVCIGHLNILLYRQVWCIISVK